MKIVNSANAPAAIGPYSQAICLNEILFISGQIPMNPKTGEIEHNEIAEQAKQVMENIKAILCEAGTSFETVVKTTCFLTDMNDFAVFNSIYEQYFTGKPARSCVAVLELPRGVRCEVEVIASLK